jgi:hypothetical protein
VNHGLEPKVDLVRSNDLRHVTRVIRLQKSNLNAFILEEPLGLSKVQRSVIRRGVPFPPKRQPTISNANTERNGQPNQFVKKVILSEDMVVALLFSQYFPLSGHRRGVGGRKHVLIAAITLIKFVTVYSQRARQSTSNAQQSSLS